MNIASAAPKWLVYIALAYALAQPVALGADSATTTANATASAEEATLRAQVLLQRAVAHYRDIEDPALADFSSKGEFVDGELYVYVVSTAGVLLASGGPSSSAIGRNVADRQDALGKPFFREMLTKAQTNEAGSVEYRWLNPVDDTVERKVAHYRKVGERIIAVGYYVARATPAQAQALLSRAVEAVRADPGKALDGFNTLLGGPYAEDDLYVFAISISRKLVLANGADPRLIGADALSLRAPGGKFVQEMIAAAGQREQGEMDYVWPNPITGDVENKHVLLRKVDDMVVGVGYYVQ